LGSKPMDKNDICGGFLVWEGAPRLSSGSNRLLGQGMGDKAGW